MDPNDEASSSVLAGHVESTDGRHVEGAVVTVLDGDGTPVAAVEASSDGSFTVRGLPAGVCWVAAQADGHHPVLDRVVATGGEPLHVVLQCTPTAVVRGSVRDGPIGRPMAGVTVRLTGAGRRPPRIATSGPFGSFEFLGVDAGELTLEVIAPDGHVGRRSLTVTLGAEVRADIDLPPLATLTVSVVAPEPAALAGVSISVVDRNGRVVRSGPLPAEGRARYGGLLPGRYHVVAGEAPPAEVQLGADGGEIRIVLDPDHVSHAGVHCAG